ncbi:MAG: PQQ-binding-like beta-propeller repeat protein [Armatimonadetes bacterium]|nr:PQQ-binding-like beta-propeller repeat protein [Armatimonadota bacterium]
MRRRSDDAPSPRRGRFARVGGGAALAALCLLLSGAPLHAQDWAMFQGDVLHSGQSPHPITVPLSLKWRYVTNRPIPGVNPSSPIIARTGLAQTRGFFVARDVVVAYNPETGGAEWFYPSSGALGAGRQTTVRTTPLYANGIVYVGAADGHLYAINAANGTLLWDYPSGAAPITASPISVGNEVFFGTATGSIVGLDARTGKPLSGQGELFKAGDAIAGSLAYADGYLYFVSRDQSAYALDLSRALAPQEGRRPRRVIRWRHALAAPPAYSSPVIKGDLIYLADGDSLVALTASRGRRRWSFTADSTLSNTPAVTDQGIFFGTRQGTFYGLTGDGRQRWKQELAGPAYSSPVVARVNPNTVGSPRYAVFVGSNRGFLYGFDTGFGTEATTDDGRLLWVYKTRPADPALTTVLNVVASPVVYDNQLYALVDDGSLLGFSFDAPDVSPPLVWGESPDRFVEISGRPPITYLVNVADDASGIDPGSIVMRVDNQPVTYTYDEYRGLIYYRFEAAKAGSREPVQPIPSGRHQVRVEVADWKGNRTVREWSFVVNTNISDVRPAAPPPPP